MIGRILSDRLQERAPSNALEQENLLAELLQCFVLASLSRARFFSGACFHGGTCLRILYGMNRVSEDLDFLTREPDSGFDWAPYLDRIQNDCRDEGLDLEVGVVSGARTAVRKALLKTDPIRGIHGLRLPIPGHTGKKIRIKLEIDTNPPVGSVFETRYLSFPLAAAVTTQTLKSGFATKAHALLCRGYTKGRDWYDFLWYASKKTVPQYDLLADALHQQGPWAGRHVEVTRAWFLAAMRDRIEEIDCSEEFFLYHLERLAEYAGDDTDTR